MGASCLGPRPRMNRTFIFCGKAHFIILKPNVWWNRKMQGVRTQVPANPGMAGRASMVSADTCARKVSVSFWQLLSKTKNLHHGMKFLFVWEKILTLHHPQGQIRHILNKIAFIAVGSVSQFWKNCIQIGDNVHERPRLAWAWFRCIFVGISRPWENTAWIRPRYFYISYSDLVLSHAGSVFRWQE